MRRLLLVVASLLLSVHLMAQAEPNGAPATTNNDDSCDIAVMPAATLLVPYFEVALYEPPATARTTVFTVTNVTRMPQIAHVTLWTDWAYPALTFNIFLTGYDVQSINLYDVLVRGVIAPGSGTSSETDEGARSLDNDANPNFASNAGFTCAHLPGAIPASLLEDVRKTLTTGLTSACGTARVGGNHPSYATGYVTIDVTSLCSPTLPTSASYYTTEILFDNALTGDVIQVDPKGNHAGGSPMVHIRAVPEGGGAGSFPGTRLPYTFYDRLTPGQARTIDRRQPLPSRFSARVLSDGLQSFFTDIVLWREAVTGADASCDQYKANFGMTLAETIRFDEHENPAVISRTSPIPEAIDFTPRAPAAARLNSGGLQFPGRPTATNDLGGWLFINANNGGADSYSSQRPGFNSSGGTTGVAFARPSQNWAVVSIYAEGRYAVDIDATVLGNGCSPAAALTQTEPIGPASNTNP
jgi:hypothetical protein